MTNIFTWLQGCASLVSALSTRYPAYVPEFQAYQSTIIKCYRDYGGLGWAQYDRAFRRQVAVTKSLNWSQINGTLYSLERVAGGFVLGPFDPQGFGSLAIQTSKISVILKKHMQGKWQLIVDLSSPERMSVNDGIDPALCSLKYT